MSYGLLGLKNQMEGEALQGLQDLSKEQHQNKMLEEQQEQAQRQQRQSSQVGMTATGATVGSYFGPWGTAIGAGVGFIVGSFM
ncbi:hypothetical protein ACT048_20760 [Ectopseudomonas khazarica]|uniref:hypothetical protein n=1 Tax=Ectopseudomonas khazarica TaxID=2502979 RepID=UPI00403420EC